MVFNPELDGLGKVEPIKQHRKAAHEHSAAAPKNNALADAMKKAMQVNRKSDERSNAG